MRRETFEQERRAANLFLSFVFCSNAVSYRLMLPTHSAPGKCIQDVLAAVREYADELRTDKWRETMYVVVILV